MLGHPFPEIGEADADVFPDPDHGELALPGQLVPAAFRNGEQIRHFGDGQELISWGLRLAVLPGRGEEPGTEGGLEGGEAREESGDRSRRDLSCRPGRILEEAEELLLGQVPTLPPARGVGNEGTTGMGSSGAGGRPK